MEPGLNLGPQTEGFALLGAWSKQDLVAETSLLLNLGMRKKPKAESKSWRSHFQVQILNESSGTMYIPTRGPVSEGQQRLCLGNPLMI